MDAEVLAGGESEREEGAGGGGREVGEEEAELGEGLLHLVHRACAVEEAERAGRVGEGVGGDERDQRRRLSCTRGHLEQRVPARVEGALELRHVRVLLRVDRRVREVHRQAIQVEPHRGESRACACIGWEGSGRRSRYPRRRRRRRRGVLRQGLTLLTWTGTRRRRSSPATRRSTARRRSRRSTGSSGSPPRFPRSSVASRI